MSKFKLVKGSLSNGIWEGHLTQEEGDGAPNITVTHQMTVVDGVTLSQDDAPTGWCVKVPVPASAISDGVQTFVISDGDTGDVLNTFSILAGDAIGEDMRAEMDLLRAELDLLKRAFRRHCVETM